MQEEITIEITGQDIKEYLKKTDPDKRAEDTCFGANNINTRVFIWKNYKKATELFEKYQFDMLNIKDIKKLLDGASYLVEDSKLQYSHRTDYLDFIPTLVEEDGKVHVLNEEGEIVGLGGMGSHFHGMGLNDNGEDWSYVIITGRDSHGRAIYIKPIVLEE